MKNLLILICSLLISNCFATDFNSPINKKYQSKNPELYKLYEDAFNQLNQWSGQHAILISAYNNLKEIIEKTLADWMGDEKQTDDIMVMGIKI